MEMSDRRRDWWKSIKLAMVSVTASWRNFYSWIPRRQKTNQADFYYFNTKKKKNVEVLVFLFEGETGWVPRPAPTPSVGASRWVGSLWQILADLTETLGRGPLSTTLQRKGKWPLWEYPGPDLGDCGMLGDPSSLQLCLSLLPVQSPPSKHRFPE